jgi:hypothetical protein
VGFQSRTARKSCRQRWIHVNYCPERDRLDNTIAIDLVVAARPPVAADFAVTSVNAVFEKIGRACLG